MRRVILGSLITTVALAATGCGNDDSNAVPDPTASSSTASPGASGSPTPKLPTPDVTTTPSAVAPATGALITSEAATVNAPADFETTPLMDSSGGNVNGPNAAYNVALSDTETQTGEESLDFVAKLSQKASVYRPALVRQPDTTIAGLPAYHLAGADSIFGTWAEEFGFRYQGHTIKVTINTPLNLSQVERDAMAAPVLASVTLLG